jgi:putative protein kinase ArgK-like GTPase of G3E family
MGGWKGWRTRLCWASRARAGRANRRWWMSWCAAFCSTFPEKTIAIVSVDPSKRKTGGALLGDRIRMNSVYNERVYMRSLATRQSNLALSRHIPEVLNILKAAQFDLIILETSGIGQSDTEIVIFPMWRCT